MGQGQAILAIQLLRECASKGHWLCLKNLHLVTSWLPALEKVTDVQCMLTIICEGHTVCTYYMHTHTYNVHVLQIYMHTFTKTLHSHKPNNFKYLRKSYIFIHMYVCNYHFHTSDQRSRPGYISYVAQLARLIAKCSPVSSGYIWVALI